MSINTQLSYYLLNNRQAIAEAVIKRQMGSLDPTNYRIQTSIRDALYNVEYLANAIMVESGPLFNAYIVWLRDVLRAYKIPGEALILHLQYLRDYVNEHVSEELAFLNGHFIESAILSVKNTELGEGSFLSQCGDYQDMAEKLFHMLMSMKKNDAVKMVLDAVHQNQITIEMLYLNVFTNVLYEVGRQWSKRLITVGQEHYATAVIVYIMSMLYDQIFTPHKKSKKLIGLCVGDELHEVGIRMVCDIFELNDWDTIYLGANVPLFTIFEEVERVKPNILAVSVTLSNKIQICEEIVKEMKIKYPEVKVIVGGQPFNLDLDLWKRIKADGYGYNAKEAVILSERLLGGLL